MRKNPHVIVCECAAGSCGLYVNMTIEEYSDTGQMYGVWGFRVIHRDCENFRMGKALLGRKEDFHRYTHCTNGGCVVPATGNTNCHLVIVRYDYLVFAIVEPTDQQVMDLFVEMNANNYMFRFWR